MRTGAISSKTVLRPGLRLTGSFYLPRDLAAAEALEKAARNVVAMRSVCKPEGIFRGPIFRRIPAHSAAHGRPYVAPAQLERIDVGVNRFLSNLHGDLLDELALRSGMLLVTCSGMSLGKVLWARDDMDGLVASHDLIRIVPDPKEIHPGYLFAYLSSRIGRLAIRRQIYGTSIKHIEPSHLFELPVVRLERKKENEIGESVVKAEAAISTGITALRQQRDRLHGLMGLSSADEVDDDEAEVE